METSSPKTIPTRTPRGRTVLLFVYFIFNALTLRADIIPRLNNGESLTVAAVGTSLTAPTWSTWLSRTGDWLNGLYPGKVALDNEGIGGSYSQSGIDTQVPAALSHNPDAIFIEFAYNDAFAAYNVSPQASRDNLQSMINTINSWAADHHKTVDIILQTMNNTTPTNGRPNLAAYYQGYRDVAVANHLLLIDHYPTWLSVYNSQPDHATWFSYMEESSNPSHPNDLGAQMIILPEIQRALFSEVPEPSCLVLLVVAIIALSARTLWKGR